MVSYKDLTKEEKEVFNSLDFRALNLSNSSKVKVFGLLINKYKGLKK